MEPTELKLEEIEGVEALRRLARGLLYDRQRAEDAVQDAWLAALRKDRSAGQGLGAWLAGAVRRLALQTRRAEARRREHEERAARAGHQPGAAEVAGRLEAVRRVMEALESLDEPYRTAIVLRFLDGLPPRAIARRLGLPVNTVRTHVRRGLARLRRRLDDGAGGRREALLGALAPLAGPLPWGSSVLGPWSGALVMSGKLKLAAVAAVVIALSFLGWRAFVDSGEDGAARAESRALLEPSGLPADAVAADDTGPDGLRPAAPGRSAVPPADWVVRGHVTIGYDGDPYPELPLVGRVHEGCTADGELLEETRLVSDEHGDFAWPTVRPEETVTLEVVPDVEEHFTRPASRIVPRGEPAPERLLVHALPIDARIVGRVVDPEGRPIGRATVYCFSEEATADADGRYSLRAATSEGEMQVWAYAPGYSQSEVKVMVWHPGQNRAVDLRLLPGMILHGRVVDERGEPVAGATVARSRWKGVRTSTDEEGRFELGSLRSLDVVVEKEGYVSSSFQFDEEERDVEVEIELPRGAVVTGRVTREDDTPLAGVWLCLGSSPSSTESVDAYSDAEGSFAFSCVPSGTRKLWAMRHGLERARLEIDVPRSGGRLDDLDVVLRQGHFLAGRVVDESGDPMPWVRITIRGGRTNPGGDVAEPRCTGPDGSFRIEGLPERDLQLRFAQRGYASVREPINQLDRDDLVVRMRAGGRLAGRVVDGATGEPVETFTIRLVNPTLEGRDRRLDLRGVGAHWVMRGMTFSGTDGYWDSGDSSFNAGEVIGIEASAEGYALAIAPRVMTEPAPDAEALVIELSRGSTVRGFVNEVARGRPVVGAKVRRFAWHAPGSERSVGPVPEAQFESLTDAGGHFELINVPAGGMRLIVEIEGRLVALDGPFDVASNGAVVERRIEAGRTARIEGRLLDAQGRTLIAQTVTLAGPEMPGRNNEHLETTSDDEGVFVFDELFEGLYHLEWRGTRGRRSLARMLRRVDLERGERVEIVLQPQGRASLAGTIDYDGALPNDLVVDLKRRADSVEPGTSPWIRWVESAFVEGGRFSFEALEPGSYSVLIFFEDPESGGSVLGSTRVEIPEEGEVEVRLEAKRQPR